MAYYSPLLGLGASISLLIISLILFRFFPLYPTPPSPLPPPRIFTAEELALYNGTNEGLPILLAVLGSVFDVSKGKSHYGVVGCYHHFSGRDASRAFVSGNFTGDGLTDSLHGLSSSEVKSVVDWRGFYLKRYIFVGKLVGRYYDNEGNPTKYLEGAEAKGARGAQLLEKQKNEEAKLPTCNWRWSQDEGSEGATIVDQSVSVTLDPDYQLPPAALASPVNPENQTPGGSNYALQKAEDVVTGMLAKGFVLGKDALNKVKSFDDQHQLSSTATSKVASFDKKIGLTEKISVRTSAVSEKVREVDKKFQVSEKAKSALAAAEQKVSEAGSAIMKNRYVFTGASFVAGAFSKVTKAAVEVGQKTIEKVVVAENEQKKKWVVDDYAPIHSGTEPEEEHPSKPVSPRVERLTDSLHGLSSSEVESVVDWRGFYMKRFVGKLVDEGNPTKYLKEAEAKGARCAQLLEKQKDEEAKLPTCNSRWSQDEVSENPENQAPGGSNYALQKAEDVVTGMLAKAFVLGKDALNKVKSFDDQHQLSSTATSKVASFDKKIGLTEKISVGTSAVNEKVSEVDEKFQVSEKAKSALAAAEQKVSEAGSAIMKNRYVFTGASFVAGAFNKVTKAAVEVGQKTIEKVVVAENEQKKKLVADDYAPIHSGTEPEEEHPSIGHLHIV